MASTDTLMSMSRVISTSRASKRCVKLCNRCLTHSCCTHVCRCIVEHPAEIFEVGIMEENPMVQTHGTAKTNQAADTDVLT
eukprot:scaffold22122_cov31-Tisochrysis_lutea.AAC.2